MEHILKEIAHFSTNSKKKSVIKWTKQKDKAILICSCGIGMSMAANKFRGIRAGVCFNKLSAQDGKEHSDINVLVLPGEFLSEQEAIEIIEIWQNSEFLNGRYTDRLQMIEKIEEENMK